MAPLPDGTAAWATAFSTGAGRAWWDGGVAAGCAFGGRSGRDCASGGWFHAGAVDALPAAACQAGWAAGGAAVEAGAEGRARVVIAALEAGVVAPDPAAGGADAEAGWGGDAVFCPGAYQGGSCFAVRGSAGAGGLLASLPPVCLVGVPPGSGWVALTAAAAWAPGSARPGLIVEALPARTRVTALAFIDPAAGGGCWARGASLAALPAGTTALSARLVVAEGAAAATPVDARLGAVSLRVGPGDPPDLPPPTLAEAWPAPAGGVALRRRDCAGGGLCWEAGAPGAVRWWEVWRRPDKAGHGPPVMLGLTRAPMWRGEGVQEEGGAVAVRARFVDGSAWGEGGW
jgi:hypothetical protein